MYLITIFFKWKPKKQVQLGGSHCTLCASRWPAQATGGTGMIKPCLMGSCRACLPGDRLWQSVAPKQNTLRSQFAGSSASVKTAVQKQMLGATTHKVCKLTTQAGAWDVLRANSRWLSPSGSSAVMRGLPALPVVKSPCHKARLFGIALTGLPITHVEGWWLILGMLPLLD